MTKTENWYIIKAKSGLQSDVRDGACENGLLREGENL